jgi:hypothetical protein
MKTQSKTIAASILAIVVAAAAANAQPAPTPPPTTPYEVPIGLEPAKKVMAAAEAEATKNNWGMAIAILDSTGHIVMLHSLTTPSMARSQSPRTRRAARLTTGARPKCSRTWWRRAVSVCARSRCAERRRWRAAYPSPWMARLSGPSASPARPRSRMAKSPRRAPTRRSELVTLAERTAERDTGFRIDRPGVKSRPMPRRQCDPSGPVKGFAVDPSATQSTRAARHSPEGVAEHQTACPASSRRD